MKATRIYLLGFMGAGKTTTGRALARKLGWKFIDLDREIEKGEGRSIAEIFRALGEPHFRELERKYLGMVSVGVRSVVALGGGTFTDDLNRALIESTGVSVWLKVSFAKVVHRVKMDGTRPMFATPEQAEHLYRIREPIYGQAKIHVSADEKGPDAVAEEIVGAIKKS